jgi:hypothetical protein
LVENTYAGVWDFYSEKSPGITEGASYLALIPQNDGNVGGNPVESWQATFNLGGLTDEGGAHGKVDSCTLGDKVTDVGVLPNNEWSYVVVTFDGTDPAANSAKTLAAMQIYVNGKKVSAVASALDQPKPMRPLFMIGNLMMADNFGNRPFNGLIDEVQVYSSVLSAGSVRELFRRRGVNMFNFAEKKQF